MAITQADIQHLLNLSRLKVTEGEAHKLAEDIQHILEHVDRLAEPDTSSVVPVTHAVTQSAVMRDDVVIASLGKEGLAGSAGLRDDGVRVPRILG